MDDGTFDWRDHIESRPRVMGGKPVVKGTRIPVEIILEWLAVGWSERELFENYPRLTPEALRAIYALSRQLVSEQLYVVPRAA